MALITQITKAKEFEDAYAYKNQVVATGSPASPCAAVGQVVFSPEDAETWHAQGKSAILSYLYTSGLLVEFKSIGDAYTIQMSNAVKVLIGYLVIREGEWISLGSTGEVILGKQPMAPPAMSSDLEAFMAWANQVRRLKASTIKMVIQCVSEIELDDAPNDGLAARNYGAQGTGLCRIEHMFFASDERIKAVGKMIMGHY
ncbi:Chain A, C3-type Pyruvate Phosphate Dikinase [Artemisia annua]|uniref:Chain A, C3-type Pyruvate Phosphate Dikinase n=1 Tax=Artemisia annua TaxID=35608 RepID=A0A2U1QDK9_ARTAN|nr:Chain A, C3-type Pyruvate Phosphate Dikinase [Artemisia annua]